MLSSQSDTRATPPPVTPPSPPLLPEGATQERQYAHARAEALRRHLRVRVLPDYPCACTIATTSGARPLLAFAVTEPATGSVTEVYFTGHGMQCACAPTAVWCEHMLAVVIDMQPGDTGLQRHHLFGE